MNIGRNEVTPKGLMPEPHTRRQALYIGDLFFTAEDEVGVDFDDPMVTYIPNGGISVPGDLMVLLRNGCGDCMRMQIARCWCMDEANGVAVLEVLDVDGVRRFPRWSDDPLVIVVLVVVACHLLLF